MMRRSYEEIIVALEARQRAEGDIIDTMQDVSAGRWDGWQMLNGGEMLPTCLMWQPGQRVAYLWMDCDPGMSGHETHGSAYELQRVARSPMDAVATLMHIDGLGWATERLREII